MTKRPTSRLRAAPFFVMRVPLLSFEELRRWSEGAVRDGEGVAEGECAPPGSFEGERDRLRHGLLSLVERPYVREAIFLASPGFESLIEGWVADPLIEGHERIEQTLCKYFARMASRPTPFGLFATISTGKTASETDLRVPPAAEITRRSRLDLGFLDQLVEAMVRDRRWRGAVPLRANPTIYRSGDSIRYVEAPFDDQGKRRHHLVALRRSRALDGALEAAGVGAGREEIERSVEQTGAETGAAARFVDQLIDAQALVPAVGAAITGPDPMNQIAEIPSSAEVRAELAAPLQQAGEALREVDEAGGFVSPHRYREIAKTLDALPRRPSVSRLFQVDAARPRSGSTVGQEVVEEVMRGVELLEGFTPERGESDLTRFRYAFEERYGQRSVPLLEVLDSESGIGYPATRQATGGRSPLVQGLDLGRSLAERQPWGARERLLLRRMTLAASEGKTELLLRNEDLASLKEKRVEPFSNRRGVMAAMVRVAAPSSEELE
ncbi:MAG TPA: lantibiotic dehydratase, partial [Thermoanaerobaculia bacterium]|nr:lantibiotic dehydratase [Thermoanaerobaculia bacterium]